MISILFGDVVEHDGSTVVIDCGGVGYGVTVCPDDQSILKTGTNAKLYIAENIKEDSHDLYGFLHKSRKGLYLQLTSVNGVGPKAGMALLAIGNENQIRKAIAEGDTAFLSRATGVGKKVAERVVVDLKNKVGMLTSESATEFLYNSPVVDSDEAVLALVALGYQLNDARLALQKVPLELSIEERVSYVLRGK